MQFEVPSKGNQLCTAARDCVKDQTNLHVHLEKRMLWKVLWHIFVPSSGLGENNIKGAFYPGAPLALLYPILLLNYDVFDVKILITL